MNCKKCGGPLYKINGLSTDRDGFRSDYYCPACHVRYGSRAHGLVRLAKKAVPGECEFKSECIHYRKA